MDIDMTRSCLVGAVFVPLLASGGCVPAPAVKTASEPESVQAEVYRGVAAAAAVDRWTPLSAQAARRLIEQYGVPDAVRSDRLTWRGNGQWKRTVARDATPLNERSEDSGVVEQTIAYRMTPRQAAELAEFDSGLEYNAADGELTARSDREEENFLRLNLADDIVHRRMRPDQAKALFAQILRLEASGKSSSYMHVLHAAR